MAHLTDTTALAFNNATHHAIILMDENGVIVSWNVGSETLFGYRADEVIGYPGAIIFTQEDIADGRPAAELKRALDEGYCEDDRWHSRKDGTRFWASGITTPAYDDTGELKGFLKVTRDKTSAKLANEQALYLALHDSLTGLPNRSFFYERLDKILSEAESNHEAVQVLLLDLDRFKDINDSYGHHVGDLFLKQVAERLTSTVRASDLVARLGGDEFGIIGKTTDAQADSETLAKKLVSSLAAPYTVQGKEIQSGASIGVSVYPLDSRDAGNMLKDADLAMYAAKGSGRSTYRRYTKALDADANRGRLLEGWLHEVLDEARLMMHYQPQYNFESQTITKVEALLRWQDCPVPDTTPDEIVATAVGAGLAEKLSAWSLRTACRQARAWGAQGMNGFSIAVNVTAGQLNTLSFLKQVDDVLQETGLSPDALELEIPESMLIENSQSNAMVFQSLRKKGIRLAVGNFGTGFSSFRALKTAPIGTLKIDRKFVQELPHSEHDAAVVSAIVGLAHSLDLKVAAEGIERPDQVEFLQALGCDYGQGFLFGIPGPAEEVWKNKVGTTRLIHLPEAGFNLT
ncbi:EAL domain-containing protein [Pseudomonas sp. NP21570]|uniref:putative bifunctional diguanylate cyclase/phosphodiesterase n=1 Tax=Stutzerimonas kunmingensis TaxID=1211807 RepID=UPI001E4F7075|nr:EAL domain-containing protein [Stutzerimonas kunmingensis]MCB4797130.1 EAL domain-containing protein [Pseudomonas sp. NP21570]